MSSRDTMNVLVSPPRSVVLACLAIATACLGGFVPAAPPADRPLTANTFVDLAARSSPAVVTVEVLEFHPFLFEPDSDDQQRFLRQFERLNPDFDRTQEGYYRSHGGSGVVVRADGIIATSLHLVANRAKDEDHIRVTFGDGRGFETPDVELLGSDHFTDLAVLRIPADGLPTLAWGDSRATRLGEWVMVIGNPLDFQFSVSNGIISGRNRRVNSDKLLIEDLLQTTAVINAGNSGGALVNLDGDLLGIVTAIATTGNTWQGLGFATPQHVAQPVIESIVERGYARRGYLGITMISYARPRGEAAATAPHPLPARGVLITGVVPGFPAAHEGLRDGDIVVAIEGEPVHDTDDVFRLVGVRQPGERVSVRLVRDGAAVQLAVPLAERPREDEVARTLARVAPSEDALPPFLRAGGGTDDADDAHGSAGGSDDDASEVDATDGGTVSAPVHDLLALAGIVVVPRLQEETGLLVIGVTAGRAAARAGLEEGDAIVAVEGLEVETIGDLRDALADHVGADSVVLTIDRAGTTRLLRLAVPQVAATNP